MLKDSPERADPAPNPRPSPFSFPALPLAANPRPREVRAARRRGLICSGAAILALLGAQSAVADPAAPIAPSIDAISDGLTSFVTEASQRFGIPSAWIRAVIRVESAGKTRAVSPKGAMGLMQIMPQTWATLRLRYGLGADPFDMHDNILAGAAFLRELYDRYGAPGFLAAYNAGPVRYEDHLTTGRPLPAETQSYVAALAPMIGQASSDGGAMVVRLVRSWTQAPLFAPRTDGSATAKSSPVDPMASRVPASSPAQDWTALVPPSDGLFTGTSRRDVLP